MTEQQHPITPPPLELVDTWEEEANQSGKPRLDYLATQAARWGADQELEACLELLDINGCPSKWIDMLRAARRPKPLSLAKQALEQLNGIETVFKATHGGDLVDDNIRRALERLQELEGKQ